eukprot:gb/GFBE01018182.1/.p1 GENE.gb/GFBE01018182.1/~~gb/GFBE01018182.1/.p1  ORF type:complete len:234 (+),score=57.40 gb/GFBE01018182.1/:1-702(+)
MALLQLPFALFCLLFHARVAIGGDDEAFTWPSDSIGERTTERVAAGKRAGKYIACTVCEHVLMSSFPKPHDPESVRKIMGNEELAEKLSDSKATCGMKRLARLFKGSKLEVVGQPDGTAVMRMPKSKSEPFYEEINKSELAFHWKSFAVEHACLEVFRQNTDRMSVSLMKEFDQLSSEASGQDAGAGDEADEQELKERLRSAIEVSCRHAKYCKSSEKLWSKRPTSRGGIQEL